MEYSDIYACEYAYDNDIRTAWATHGQSVGSWIKLDFQQATVIGTMCLQAVVIVYA